MEVKGFNNHELNEAFMTTPKIVCDYISALQRVLDMSEETNKKAVAKIRSLLKEYVEETQREEKSPERKTKKTSNIICPFCNEEMDFEEAKNNHGYFYCECGYEQEGHIVLCSDGDGLIDVDEYLD